MLIFFDNKKKNTNLNFLSTVTISDSRGTGFKGLLLQARNVDGTDQLGTWQNTPKGLQTLKCQNENDAVTHDSNDVKKTAVIQWLPQYNYGDVQFRFVEKNFLLVCLEN